ncbi:hypothetical protein QLQ12_10310 [Actinoplanes sp. NEAU-A12]|uniref:ABC transporter permease n=1 Tax=Actinoplanes sandaracinus TaxID=3045177 RepID=A0ABT6WGY5_9ACTN|nr:hypothetical protein [Actinoplanes sandaracinus]MDI6098993.1 hypothetical protein [Actinoplanes sandaracinus]
MSRVLLIELRRSAALGTALILAVAGVVLLYFAGDAEAFKTGWMQLAMNQRLFLAVLWPLALAAGAWQASREHRSKVAELFDSTPRPTAHRTVPTLGVMAVAVICGYLVMGIAGGLSIISTAEYLPVGVFVVTAVGALALVAAVWLGQAIGRLLPWLLTAPALGIAGLALLLLIPAATRPHGWLALVFSPIYEMNMPSAYATVPGKVSAAQAVWLAALAGTAVLLSVAGSRRLRVAALLPVALGAALAIAVMPHQNRIVTDAVDPVAKALVCTDDEPRVCVGRVHSGLLSAVTAPAREGLAALAKLPGAPTLVHEDTTTYFPDVYPQWRTDVTLVRVNAGASGHVVDKGGVRGAVVTGAFASPPGCEESAPAPDRFAAAYWLIGREPLMGDFYEPEEVAEAMRLWNDLRRLPEGEAQARVAALRQAALACAASDGLFPQDKP